MYGVWWALEVNMIVLGHTLLLFFPDDSFFSYISEFFVSFYCTNRSLKPRLGHQKYHDNVNYSNGYHGKGYNGSYYHGNTLHRNICHRYDNYIFTEATCMYASWWALELDMIVLGHASLVFFPRWNFSAIFLDLVIVSAVSIHPWSSDWSSETPLQRLSYKRLPLLK